MDPRFGKSSASRLHIVVNCPGFIQLWDSLKMEGQSLREDSPDASFGIQVHAAWAGNLSELSLSERQQLVKQKADRIRARLIQEVFGCVAPITFAETRFRLFDKARSVIHTAQIDWAGHVDGKWLVLDLKSLYGDVEPPDQNWQLLSQATCIGDDDDVRNMNGVAEIKEITCGIVQPLITLKPELVRYTAHDLARAKLTILKKLDEAAAPNAPRIPGLHCKWCPASSYCPESAADLMAVTHRYSLGVEHLNPTMVANILPHLPALEKRIKDFKDRAKKLAEQNMLPGYGIKEVDGNRYIQSQASIQEVRDKLSQYLNKEDILPLLSLPFGELRQLFIEKYRAGDKIEAGKLFDKLIAPCVKRERPKRLLEKISTAGST